MFHGKNRRQYSRFDTSGLLVTVKHYEISGDFKNSEKVTPVDFSPFGIAFESVQEFDIGDKIILELSKNRERISGIIGTISNILDVDEDKTRYGVEFDFTANEHMCSEEVENALNNIKQQLKKRHSSMNRNVYRRIKNPY